VTLSAILVLGFIQSHRISCQPPSLNIQIFRSIKQMEWKRLLVQTCLKEQSRMTERFLKISGWCCCFCGAFLLKINLVSLSVTKGGLDLNQNFVVHENCPPTPPPPRQPWTTSTLPISSSWSPGVGHTVSLCFYTALCRLNKAPSRN
jgi:hypothetical protein